MSKCRECLGESTTPECIELEGEYDNLGKLLPSLMALVTKDKAPLKIDTKTLTNKTLTRDEIIQLLINEVIILKKKLNETQTVINTNGLCPNVNWDMLNQCMPGDSSFCDKLQNLINIVYQINNNV